MVFHPLRCLSDVTCLVGVGASVLGVLPILAAFAASVAALIYYYLMIKHLRNKP